MVDLTRVALATCGEVPDGDEDAPAIGAALREGCVEAVSVPGTGSASTGVRSTWSSFARPGTTRSATRSSSPGSRLSLARESGRRRVRRPTSAISPSSRRPARRSSDRVSRPRRPVRPPSVAFVVKPAISAGGRHAASYRPEAAASAVDHVHRLHAAGRTVILQPYLDAARRPERDRARLRRRPILPCLPQGLAPRRRGRPATGLYLEEEIESPYPPPPSTRLPSRRSRRSRSTRPRSSTHASTSPPETTGARWCSRSSWPSRRSISGAARVRRSASPGRSRPSLGLPT